MCDVQSVLDRRTGNCSFRVIAEMFVLYSCAMLCKYYM